MKRVLILCTGNSCRSQMAEGLWNHLADGSWQAFSAGSKPSGYVHPLAVQALRELGLDISANDSKSVLEFSGQSFDLVVTVCDHAKDSCPAFPGARDVLHWPFDDPAEAQGSDEAKMLVFRRVRDEIRRAIVDYLKVNSARNS
jgi:arsenate reductase